MTLHHELKLVSIFVLLVLIPVLTAPMIISPGKAASNPPLIPASSKVYGLTYADWTTMWWQWLLSKPLNTNPAGDTTGVRCSLGQSGPVWFLAGTLGGAAERSCTIPAGKAILFPILNAECSYTEYPNLRTQSDLASCAKSIADTITNQHLRIDGVDVQGLQNYRVKSPLFTINFPEGNIYGVKAGPTQGYGDGYYVFLPPLTPGKHDIEFTGAIVGFSTTEIPTFTFSLDTIYHLTVL